MKQLLAAVSQVTGWGEQSSTETRRNKHERSVSLPQTSQKMPHQRSASTGSIIVRSRPRSRSRPNSMGHLPPMWNKEHDMFICFLDGHHDMDLLQITSRLRHFFPYFASECIGPEIIETRLKILDLNTDIPYFSWGRKEVQTNCRWAKRLDHPYLI
ncbi:MAG: hypothetical protein M1814_000016 [Vezdaea aestivalis]|nr:MAG: hypothetical protein M1814_000016 [Vezdaea aestivalis]